MQVLPKKNSLPISEISLTNLLWVRMNPIVHSQVVQRVIKNLELNLKISEVFRLILQIQKYLQFLICSINSIKIQWVSEWNEKYDSRNHKVIFIVCIVDFIQFQIIRQNIEFRTFVYLLIWKTIDLKKPSKQL